MTQGEYPIVLFCFRDCPDHEKNMKEDEEGGVLIGGYFLPWYKLSFKGILKHVLSL